MHRRLGPPPKLKSVRERFGAMRHVVPLFGLVWRTSRPLTLGTMLVRLVRALLPVMALYVGKLIIDEVIAKAALPNAPSTLTDWLASGLLDRAMWLIAAEFGLAIVSLCVKAVQIRIQQSLENLGKKLLRDFVEFLRQMGKDLLRLVRCSWLIHLGFHELSTDDILASTEVPAHPMSAPPFDGLLSRPGWPDAQAKKAAK